MEKTKPEGGGQPRGSATEEGANQVPPPVKPTVGQHPWSEVEQKEACHRTRMRTMENEEGWLKCSMLKRSSCGPEKAFLDERGAELDVFVGISSTD